MSLQWQQNKLLDTPCTAGARSRHLGQNTDCRRDKKKFKLLFKKVSKSGSKPVRFPTVIRKVACFWTVFFKTFKTSVSNLHCSVPCVTRTYPQYRDSRKSVTNTQTHKHTHTQTNGTSSFDSPTNVRALRAIMNNQLDVWDSWLHPVIVWDHWY